MEISPLLRDFQAEGESPALGLFHAAAFSTALLPTNSAKEPSKGSQLQFDVAGTMHAGVAFGAQRDQILFLIAT